MNRPLVSVIMPVYNGERFVRDAVESILTQTYTNFELIIIDDGSNDKTYEILNFYKDERLKIFKRPHEGVARSLNYALNKCKGVYIALQAADDISVRNRLELQVNFLESHPEIAGVGSYILIIKWDREILLCKRQVDPELIRRIQLERKGTGVTHGSLMHRSSVIERIGGYDERIQSAVDYDFLLRMAERFDLSNIPRPLYIIREHPDQISTRYREEQRKNAEIAWRLALERRANKGEDTHI